MDNNGQVLPQTQAGGAAQAPPRLNAAAVEKVLLKGDLADLSPAERVSYYKAVCDSVGLNPLTKPFEFMVLNGKTVLYAGRNCTDQLRYVHKISVKIVSREKIGDVYVVTALAKTPDGREDESTGAVSIGKLYGDALANAYMKAETKAKRRVTLSICGLSLLDETEVESVPTARPVSETEVVPPSEPKDVSSPPPQEQRTVNSALPRQVTPKQVNRLYAIAHDRRWTRADVSLACEKWFGKADVTKLVRTEYDKICQWILDGRHKPGENPVGSDDDIRQAAEETDFAPGVEP